MTAKHAREQLLINGLGAQGVGHQIGAEGNQGNVQKLRKAAGHFANEDDAGDGSAHDGGKNASHAEDDEIGEIGAGYAYGLGAIGKDAAAERAQHIVVMYKGQVVESGPSLEVLQHPQHPYTKRLVAAAPSLASQRIISAKERGEDADALLDHHIAGESTLEKSEHIITVDHLTKEFKLPRKKEMFKAVDDVSFSVKRGTTLAIVGESGSGKSTVANMVLHLLKPTSGKVFYEGRDTSTFKSKDLLGFRRHVQPVFQNPYGSLDPMYSIFRSIEEPLRIHKIGDKKWRANRVKELLDMVEMPASVMGRYPNELSGGQRRRVALLRALLAPADVVVLDEPFKGLDEAARQAAASPAPAHALRPTARHPVSRRMINRKRIQRGKLQKRKSDRSNAHEPPRCAGAGRSPCAGEGGYRQ